MRKETKNNRRKGRKIVIAVLMAVLAALFLFAGYRVWSILTERAEGAAVYHKVAEEFVTERTEQETPEVNFGQLQEKYPQSVGWIRIPGTRVDYPFAQWTDNDYYINHLLDGTRNGSGTVFVDYRCSADMTDQNTFLYGHHMKNGTMFAQIVEYKNQEFYEEHPLIEISLADGSKYIGEIFSAHICETSDAAFTYGMLSDAEFEKYLSHISGRSLIRSDVEVSAEDRILTLSTCTYEYDNARFLVHAKLVPAE